MTGLLADETMALAEQARAACWPPAAKATRCARSWPFCGGWRATRLPMRWR